jgi:hypothetical protein
MKQNTQNITYITIKYIIYKIKQKHTKHTTTHANTHIHTHTHARTDKN